MSAAAKTRLLKYGLTGLAAAGMVILYVNLREFATLPLVEKYLVLCDGFTIPGLVLVMVGLLIWLTNLGALDGISYAVGYAFKMLVPGYKDKQETYGDYVARKREKRVTGYGFLFVVGGICLAAALVFMVLFYSIYQK